MKKSKIRKISVTVLAFVLVFAFASTAFADSLSFNGLEISGGFSKPYAGLINDYNYGVRCVASLILWNGQEHLKYRGYSNQIRSTVLVEVTGAGVYNARYTLDEYPFSVTAYASIASTSTDDHLYFYGGFGA